MVYSIHVKMVENTDGIDVRKDFVQAIPSGKTAM